MGRETLGVMEGFISASSHTRSLSQSVTLYASLIRWLLEMRAWTGARTEQNVSYKTCRHVHIYSDNEDKGAHSEHKDITGGSA